jgi:chromosome segregation protein
LQQLNRLVALKRDLEEVAARAQGAAQAHQALSARLAALTEADSRARTARREADRLVAEANRALARAEADRDLAEGRREASTLALARHEDEALAARKSLAEAEKSAASLADLAQARKAAEEVRTAVEAARITMMTRRSAHDEVRRAGEGRTRRAAEIAKEIKGWQGRLDTAAQRMAELEARRAEAASELAEAETPPPTSRRNGRSWLLP